MPEWLKVNFETTKMAALRRSSNTQPPSPEKQTQTKVTVDKALTQRNGAWIDAHKCGNGGDDGGVDRRHSICVMLHVKTIQCLKLYRF